MTYRWGHKGKGAGDPDRDYPLGWKRLRICILERDSGMCQSCLRQGFTILAKDVDHIIPKACGGTDDPCNLQSLCRACHKQKTGADQRGDGIGRV